MNMHIQAKHVTGARIEPVIRRAQRMFDENKGDKARTIRELVNLAETSKSVREHLIKLGATALVGGLVCKERARIVRGADDDSAVQFTTTRTIVTPPVMSFATAEAIRKVKRAVTVRAWMNFRLPTAGNKRLGQATATDLKEGAEMYRRQSGDMQHKAAWLEAIRPKVPRGKTVADVLDNATLDALYESVAA